MTERAVVIVGSGPTGLMLAGELALAAVDVATVERRTSQDLLGARAVCTRAPSRCSISAASPNRFLAEGQAMQIQGVARPRHIHDCRQPGGRRDGRHRPGQIHPAAHCGGTRRAVLRIPLDISDFPTRHNSGLGLWQKHIERILAGWAAELGVPISRGREVTGLAQDDTSVDIDFYNAQGAAQQDQ
jgi:2-polyprenyl-6-methoxyphenol hydroxylase-like FAD-dependent oxidoreductase